MKVGGNWRTRSQLCRTHAVKQPWHKHTSSAVMGCDLRNFMLCSIDVSLALFVSITSRKMSDRWCDSVSSDVTRNRTCIAMQIGQYLLVFLSRFWHESLENRKVSQTIHTAKYICIEWPGLLSSNTHCYNAIWNSSQHNLPKLDPDLRFPPDQ